MDGTTRRTAVTRTRTECVRAAAAVLVVAWHQLDALPVAEAARRAYTPTGSSLAVLAVDPFGRRSGVNRHRWSGRRGRPSADT